MLRASTPVLSAAPEKQGKASSISQAWSASQLDSSFSLASLSRPQLGGNNAIIDVKAHLSDDTHPSPLQPPGHSKCSIKVVRMMGTDGKRPRSLALLQKHPPWGPSKTPAGCAGQHMAGGRGWKLGEEGQLGAGKRRQGVLRKKEKPTQNRQNSSRLFLLLQMYINAGEAGTELWAGGKRNSSF